MTATTGEQTQPLRRALFLHIQKTAGTSIQVLARQAYGNENVCSHGDFLRLGIAGCSDLPFVSGHFGFAFAREIRKDRYCFTVLRDPVDRLLSLYYFCAAQPPEGHFLYEAANRLDLDGFLALADEMPYRHALWNNMIWQLTYGWGHSLVDGRRRRVDEFDPQQLLASALRNLETLDYVGFVDTLNADIDRVFGNLGASSRTLGRHNAAEKRPSIANLADTTIERLNAMTALDREFYSKARAFYRNGRPRRSWLRRWLENA